MSELFDDEEDKSLVVEDEFEEVEAVVVVDTKPRQAADARRRLEDLLEERRLRQELEDFLED